MISTASLQRTVAVMAVLLGLCIAEGWLFSHGQQLLPGTAGRLVAVVCAFGLLAVFAKLTSWERRRRRRDEDSVQRVVEAARSVGVEVPEDRAIFPIFFRGPKRPQNAPGPGA
jgi:hypothetical protein